MKICPTCKNANIRQGKHHEYCGECGLVMQFPLFKRRRDAKSKPVVKKKIKVGVCLACRTKDNLTLHHVVPKRVGGRLQKVILCRTCHNVADVLANALYPNSIQILEKGGV